MEQLLEYRVQLVSRLENAVDEFCEACRQAPDPHKPADGWTVHQVAVHVRDGQTLVYGLRARRTAAEENPSFEDFDQDGWMAGHYDRSEPLEKVLSELKESAFNLVQWLRDLPSDTWARESRHEVMGGGFTLQTWVERGLAHVEGHLEEVKSKT